MIEIRDDSTNGQGRLFYIAGLGEWYRQIQDDPNEVLDWLIDHDVEPFGHPLTFLLEGDLEVLFKLRFL